MQNNHIEALAPTSKVWIYQNKTAFTPDVAKQIQHKLAAFAQNWTSHNNQLIASAALHKDRFIVLMVDESNAAGASGCSIDKSVHFMKNLEKAYGADLFDRMHFSYLQGKEVHTVSRAEFAKKYESGIIDDDTLVFDHLVKTKQDFDANWIKPLKESWHKRMV